MTERAITHSIEVHAPIEEVWSAWTTESGARTFFAPEARIEARPGGSYELYFAPSAPEGTRGSEGCTVTEAIEGTRLSFTWNFPPDLPTIRSRHTQVSVSFTRLGRSRTTVVLVQTGWKDGSEWDRGYEYFEQAWKLVLARLAHRFEHGPLDWSNPWYPPGMMPSDGAA